MAQLKYSYLLKIGDVRALELRSASPNMPTSIHGVVIDAFAFIDNPLYLVRWVR